MENIGATHTSKWWKNIFPASLFIGLHHLAPLFLPLLGKLESHVLNSGWIRANPCCCSTCELRSAAEMRRPLWRQMTKKMSWKSLVLGRKPHPFDLIVLFFGRKVEKI